MEPKPVLCADFVRGKLLRDGEIVTEVDPALPFLLKAVVDDESKTHIGAIRAPLTLWLTAKDGTLDKMWDEKQGVSLTAKHLSATEDEDALEINFKDLICPIKTGRYYLVLFGGCLKDLGYIGASKRLPNDANHKPIEFFVPNKSAVLAQEKAEKVLSVEEQEAIHNDDRLAAFLAGKMEPYKFVEDVPPITARCSGSNQ
jgi:hypothetical protein